jgi:TonB family protein
VTSGDAVAVWTTPLAAGGDARASRLNRMSPTAAATSALLHAVAAAYVFYQVPQTPARAAESVIEISVDRLTWLPAGAPTLMAPSSDVTTPPSSLEPAPAPGLPLPGPMTGDAPADIASAPSDPVSGMPTAATQSVDDQGTTPQAEPQHVAAEPTPSPPEPKLDEHLPTLEAPPPVAATDFAKAAPAPTPKPRTARPPARAQASPLAQPVPPSPLSGASQQPAHADTRAPVRPAPSLSTTPGNDSSQRKAQEDYFWQVIRKLSQYRFNAKSRDDPEQGLVVTRLTVARDGRLVDVSLARSSGFPNLDQGVMDTIRRASPFAALPADIAGDPYTFVVPINYVHER